MVLIKIIDPTCGGNEGDVSNFDSVGSKGMHNVGGSEGYDKVTDWSGIKGIMTTMTTIWIKFWLSM